MELELIATVKNHLCNNCIHQFNCALQSNLVLECEEHTVESGDIPSIHTTLTEKSTSDITPTHEGICNTCSLAIICTWRQEETIRFHCEHYQ